MGDLVRRLARIEAQDREARLNQSKEQFFQCLANLNDTEVVRAILLWGDLGEERLGEECSDLEGKDAHCWAAFVSSGAWQSAQAFCEIVEELPEAEWDHHIKRLLDDPRYQARLPKLQSIAFDLGFR